MDEIVREFLAESHENLDQLERDLLAVEHYPNAPDLLASVFRTVHSIKGTSGMLGFGAVEELAHTGESLLAGIRDGCAPMTPETVDALLQMSDSVRGLLGAAGTSCPSLAEAPGRRTPTEAVAVLWARLTQLARSLGAQHGKQVRVTIDGGDVELERTLLEAVRDPLTHLVRNAVDHGLETPEVRVAAGKPHVGTVALRACRTADQVLVEVSDDGAGIDLDQVAACARRSGALTTAELRAMSRCELLRLVLLPGLSTSPSVTHLSGRGVGMDVVRANVEELGGEVEIESGLGVGTTCRLRIPH